VDLALTGAYPVLPWTAYVLAGMAVGRAGLEGRRPLQFLVGGGVAAVTAKVTSSVLLASVGGTSQLSDDTQGLPPVTSDLDIYLQVGFYGTVPTSDWRWLVTSGAHSATPLDLLHTGAAAIAILGGCLVVARHVRPVVLAPLVAVGSMTLTLYTAHVLSLWRGGPLTDVSPGRLYVAEAAACVLLALLWRWYVGRGPLEAVSARLERAARHPFSASRSKSGDVRMPSSDRVARVEHE
jgi:drug/metabolite transporter superfamily protein YnfA